MTIDRPPSLEERIQSLKPDELKTEEDLLQFWLAYLSNNNLSLGNSDLQRKIYAVQAKIDFDKLKDGAVSFFGIKDGEKMVATGKLDIYGSGNEKHAYLSFLSVDEEYRGKGLAKKLTDIRVDKAKELGCFFVETDVFTENPIALVTKFNDDYILVGIDISYDIDSGKYGGKFKLRKDLREEKKDDEKEREAQYTEVAMTELTEIERMLKNGEWEGVDIKNLGDATDNNPENWKLILEKKK